ncbi:hypothetical protein GQ42DRAFT_24645 [Ramicandelaber brevisporus]|nr:hypothetical protein GQ42DRAFT_24645 [Ramicandelaber brevisporus]
MVPHGMALVWFVVVVVVHARLRQCLAGGYVMLVRLVRGPGLVPMCGGLVEPSSLDYARRQWANGSTLIQNCQAICN